MSQERRILYRGGTIMVGDSPADERLAEAMLVAGDRVLWLGREADAVSHVDAASSVLRLDGALVTPAFVDAHAHLSQTGAGLRGVDLGTARSLHDALSRVESGARAGRGRPLLVQNWDETSWPERRPFTAAELDRASYGGVVYAPRVDGHCAMISSALAAAAGVHGATPGMSDGLVRTEAHHRAREVFGASVTRAQRRDDVAAALRAAAAAGIGSVHENAGPLVSSAQDLADVLHVARQVPCPLVVGYWAQLVDTAERARETAARHGVAGLAGDLNLDGSIGSRTASLRAPYADQPGETGSPFLTVEQVRDHVVACTRAGLQAGFHVIGDRGADTAVAGFEAAAAAVGPALLRRARHRLEHLEMVDAVGIRRLAALGVVASVQPAFDARWGGRGGMYAQRLGTERAGGMNRFRTMLDAGLHLALGSDSPVTPFAPWDAVRACVLHHDVGQRISAAAAFRAHTVGGWRAARLDGRGLLKPGAEATFVVWDHHRPGLPDLCGGDPAPSALRTVVAGRLVHDAM